MDLKISRRDREDVTIFDLEGRIVAGDESDTLRDTVRAAGQPRVILNCAGVAYIDSSGLGTLVYCHTTLEKQGGGVRLVDLNERNLELMVLTKLSIVLRMFDDEQQAINSFFPGREAKAFDILSFVQAQKKRKAGS